MPIEPDFAEVFATALRSFLLDVHTCVPAVTRSYDAATQRGNFLPVVKGALQDADGNNVFELRPEIQNVPVHWEGAGGYYSHRPLTAGVPGDPTKPPDFGLLIFSEDSYAHWRATGEISEPGALPRHSISYPIFLPGLRHDLNPLPDAPAEGEAVEIVPAGGRLRVSTANAAHVEFVALADKVKTVLQGIIDALNNAVPAPGAADGGAGLLTSIKHGLAGLSTEVASTTLAAEG